MESMDRKVEGLFRNSCTLEAVTGEYLGVELEVILKIPANVSLMAAAPLTTVCVNARFPPLSVLVSIILIKHAH